MRNKEITILVHGYNKNGSDMYALRNHLHEMGHHCLIVNLPATFGTLADCTDALEAELNSIMSMFKDQKVHLVGHSMGGLIIRSFLAGDYSPRIGRCVLIAPPNNGSRLADIVNLFPPAIKIFKPLDDLRTRSNTLPLLSPPKATYPEIGIIAGNKSNLLLGAFLRQENDGRVEVESTRLEGMTDFIVKPYGHKEIHYKQEVADLVDQFLRHGRFTAKRA